MSVTFSVIERFLLSSSFGCPPPLPNPLVFERETILVEQDRLPNDCVAERAVAHELAHDKLPSLPPFCCERGPTNSTSIYRIQLSSFTQCSWFAGVGPRRYISRLNLTYYISRPRRKGQVEGVALVVQRCHNHNADGVCRRGLRAAGWKSDRLDLHHRVRRKAARRRCQQHGQ